MGTTVEELKKLYKKLGGKDKQVATFNQPGEVINAINELDLPTDYELPKVTTTDVGKVLTVSDEGKWDAEIPTKELPAVTSEDEGKVLTVDSEGAWGAETPTKELPAVTSEDNGNVLSVVDGAWAKAAPSGGGNIVITGTISGFFDSTSTENYSITNLSMTRNEIIQFVKDNVAKIDRIFLVLSSGPSPNATRIVLRLVLNVNNPHVYFGGVYIQNDSPRFLCVDINSGIGNSATLQVIKLTNL